MKLSERSATLSRSPVQSGCGRHIKKTAAQPEVMLPKKVAKEVRKPSFVPRRSYPLRGDDHSSRTAVADGLKQPDPGTSDGPPSNVPLFGLAPDGVYRASDVTVGTGELLPHPFTLTRRHPKVAAGGLLSVALSLGSPPVPVRDHPVLRSPDFPPVHLGRSRWTSDHLSFFDQRLQTCLHG